MSLAIQISSSLLPTSANKRQTFFTSRVLFGVGGAAYTRVVTVYNSLHCELGPPMGQTEIKFP